MSVRSDKDRPTPSKRFAPRGSRGESGTAATPAPPKHTSLHYVVDALAFVLKEIAQNNPDVRLKAETHERRLTRILQHEQPAPAAAPPDPSPVPAATDPAKNPPDPPEDEDEDEEEDEGKPEETQPPPARSANAAQDDPQAIARMRRPSTRFTKRA